MAKRKVKKKKATKSKVKVTVVKGLYCSICLEKQFKTRSGITCCNGHGGAKGIRTRPRKKIKKKKTVLAKLNTDKQYTWLTIEQRAILQEGGYFDSEGVLHKSDGCIRCTSMVKASGKRCNNFAVPGELYCRCHGGVLARSSAQKGTRVYSAFIQNPEISAVYESIVNDDELRGMKEELGMLRALLAKVVGDEAEYINSNSLKSVASVVGEIRQLINDCTKTEVRLGQLIDVGKITIIIKQLAAIIQKHVLDEETIRKIANEFDNVIWPGAVASTPQPEHERPVQSVPNQTY